MYIGKHENYFDVSKMLLEEMHAATELCKWARSTGRDEDWHYADREWFFYHDAHNALVNLYYSGNTEAVAIFRQRPLSAYKGTKLRLR